MELVVIPSAGIWCFLAAAGFKVNATSRTLLTVLGNVLPFKLYKLGYQKGAWLSRSQMLAAAKGSTGAWVFFSVSFEIGPHVGERNRTVPTLRQAGKKL